MKVVVIAIAKLNNTDVIIATTSSRLINASHDYVEGYLNAAMIFYPLLTVFENRSFRLDNLNSIEFYVENSFPIMILK